MSSEIFLQQLLSLPTITSAMLSPDGRMVAFVWYRIHAAPDVFVVPADGSASPIPLTNTGQATRLVSWAPGSRAVIVAEDHDGNERVRLFRVELEHPGRMEALTEDAPGYFIRGGAISADGTTLFYGMNYDVERHAAIEPTWIYRHDLETGERSVLARPAHPAWSAPQLNQAGTQLLYTRKDRHPAGEQVWLVDVEGGEDRELFNFGDAVKVRVRWLPDSLHIAVLSESRDGNPQQHQSLGLYNLEDGSMRWLIDDPRRNIESIGVSPDGTLIAYEIQGAMVRASAINPVSGVETPFPHLAGNLAPLGHAADGAWVGLFYASTSPAELVRFELEDGHVEELESLTHVWEQTRLNPGQLVTAEDFHWRSSDGLAIQGWLYRSLPNPQRAVIHIHGGPTSHSQNALDPEIQYLVSQGFNVLDVNYRGSTGFGLAYRESIKVEGWGGREQEDISAGAEALIREGLAEPGRIGVTGTSYGGYSAWCQITRMPIELIAAAAPICGMTDLVIDYQTTRPDLRPYSEEMIGGRPDQVPDRYYERSPINFVNKIKGKLLIVQGAQDPNVSPENVDQVIKQLDEHHIPYELLVFEDEGHGIKKLENQAVLYERLVQFFRAALG